MNRVLLLSALLVTATIVALPGASAAPPDCVSYNPLTPNPIQVEPGPCSEFREYVCYQTIGKLIPYNCDQG